MKKGILIISIGKPLYGRLACVLAASIKCNSTIPIHLIHDSSSIKDLSNRQMQLFDIKTLLQPDTALTDSENAFRTKTEAYRHSQFEQTLMLDADCIMLPGKKADAWFDELKGIKFTACCMGGYKYADGSNYNKQEKQTYPYWGVPEEVKKHFNILDDSVLPQINTSLVYFEKCAETEELFRVANNVYKDTTFKPQSYRNSKPDEFCFNVACALTKTFPHNFNYRPLYFFFTGENISEPAINDNYNALSVIADAVFDDRILEMYNKYMDYYFSKFGFKERFYFSDKTQKDARPIIGFWHIAAMGNWQDVIKEQLMILKYDGLYEMCSEIMVSVGGDNCRAYLEELFSGYPKIKIHFNCSLSDYEFPALQMIKARAVTDKFYGFYFHTKGVSQPNSVNKGKWRDLLNHYVLRCWEKCYDKVRGIYDVAGANWKMANNDHPAHFSGNFYWFDSEYIKKLPEVYALNRRDRYKAEMWLSANNPKVFCITSHVMQDDIAEWFPERKIGLFWKIENDYAPKISLLRNSELLAEAHRSVAFTGTPYDLSGFTTVSPSGFDALLKTYCILHPDAFIATCAAPEGIVEWKRCYNALLSGYDSVVNDRCEMLWVTASLLNAVDHDLELLAQRKHRKFIL